MTIPINVEAYKRIHENSKLAFCIIEGTKNQDSIIDFSFIYANPALSELFDTELSKLYKKPFYQLFPDFDINLLNTVIKSLEDYETQELQMLVSNLQKPLQAIVYPIGENVCSIIILDFSQYSFKIKENQFLQKTLNEARQANHIFTKVEKLFGRFVLLDFENNTYQFLGNVIPYNNIIATSGKYDKFVNHLVNMLLEDKEHIYNILQKDNLMEYLYNENCVFPFIVHIFRNGPKYESCNIIPLKFKDNNCCQAILTQQDITNIITERENNLIILNEALKSAKLANEAKSNFLSNISHDLRTPLNTILGMSTIAQINIKDNDAVLACLEKINIAGSHLLQIINQILDMSKIEKGKEVLNNSYFSMNECINEIVSIVSPNCKLKNISFNIMKNFSTDKLFGDFLRLKRILINLLDNATKYTNENGNISFSITEKNSEIDNYACFEFIVKDNGIGMDEEFVKHIFEPFTRAKNNNYIVGAGLGMPIAKNTIHLMKGDIEVKSQIDKGTTITAIVYLQKVENNHTSQENSNFNVDLTSKKILLVEDNDLNIEVAKTLFESMGHRVVSCKNGKDAVNAMINQNDDYFDIIFMDIRMPTMDGYQTSSAIRKLNVKNSKFIPIIAMSADVFVDNINLAKKSGMNDFLAKPISINEIKRILIKYFTK